MSTGTTTITPESRLESAHLDNVFSALSNTTRRALLSRLAEEGEANVNDLAEPFDLTLPAISKHLKTLEAAGLIERTRRAQFRPCRLKPESLDMASEWIDHQKDVWSASFDRLERYIDNIGGRKPDQPATGGRKSEENTKT